jgi:integrase
MTAELREWLRDVYGLHQPFMLAPTVKHGRYRYRYDFRKAFDALVNRCGLAVTFHDLRRTFASLLVSRGVSLYKVAKWLGDELVTVQTHYGHLIPQDDEINASWRAAR